MAAVSVVSVGCNSKPYGVVLHSDQTDPFNRSPLTMDQIRHNEELKQQILQWLDKHRQERLQMGPSG